MRIRNRYFLALSAVCAVCCLPSAYESSDGSLSNESIIATSAYAQDDDPFADDSDSDDADDPFAAAVADDSDSDDADDPFAAAVADDSDSDDADDPFAAAVADDSDSDDSNSDDSNDPFAKHSPNDPFVPSRIANSEPAPTAPVSPKKESKGSDDKTKEDDPRAKYIRPEDVPDELKTEEDFIATSNAAERAIMGQNPTNSAELFSAAARVARIGRVLYAKILVEKALNAPDPTPEEAAKILDSLGSGRASYFIALPEVSPAAAQTYNKVVDIARKAWESEKTLRAAIERANFGSTNDRAQAILDVRRGGAQAVALLVGDLLSGDEKKVKVADSLLPFFESNAIEATIAALRNAPTEKILPIVDYLAAQTDKRVGDELLALYYGGTVDDSTRDALANALAKQYDVLPTKAEFALAAYQKAFGYFNRKTLFPNTVDGETERWVWDDAKGTPSKKVLVTEDSYLDEAAYLAKIAVRIGESANALPSSAKELAALTSAEFELASSGLDSVKDALEKVKEDNPNLKVDDLQSAIRLALDSNRFKGALVLTAWLAEVGDESIVYSYNQASAIVRAATCPDRRVRYEAISAIVKWNPQRSYIGSTNVGRMLEWFATSTGKRVAVVACNKLDECAKIGGYLQQCGYKIVPVTTGRDAILAAQASADVEFVYANANVTTPDIRYIAQTLRADARTYDVPLLVGTTTDYEDPNLDGNETRTSSDLPTLGIERVGEDTRANLLVGREPNAFVYPKPYDLQSASMALQRLFDYTKPNQVVAEKRLAQAQAAAKAFLALSVSRPAFYEFDRMNDLTRTFLANPISFDLGLEYAAVVKTNYAQNALVELIGDTRMSLQERRKALDAFERQLAANGSLLRGPEVVRMYDRYNASEFEDADTQKILSDMLDVYEKATKR